MSKHIQYAAIMALGMTFLVVSTEAPAQSDEQSVNESSIVESGEGIVRGLYADDGSHCKK